jgi:hypothetical protein
MNAVRARNALGTSGALSIPKTRLVTWGCNISGQLGRGDVQSNQKLPDFVQTPLNDPPIQVSAGWGHTSFVTYQGKCVVFGRAIDMRNTLRFGKLAKTRPNLAYLWTQYFGGKGSIDFLEPTIVSPESMKCTKVSSSAALTLGITDTGGGFSLGANRYGQTGVEDVTDDRPVFSAQPIKFPLTTSKIVDIAAGHQNALAVDDKGCVYAWGKGDRGQCGLGEDGVKKSPTRSPTRIEILQDDPITSVSCGFFHCLALSKQGNVYVWGKHQNEDGTKDVVTPFLMRNLPPIVEAACGQYHCVVRDQEGNVYQWGLRPFELGSGFVSQPQKVQGIPKGACSLTCGFTESAMINDGLVYVWDWNDMKAKPMKELEQLNVRQFSLGWRHRAAVVLSE